MIDADAPSINVLIVEDDLAQARWVSRLITDRVPEGVNFITFTDSVAACRCMENQWVDVIITDLDMPEIDGLALVRRARQFNPRVQVIIMTAASTSEALIEAGDIGVADFLVKPIDIGVVAELVEQATERLWRWRDALAETLASKRGGGDSPVVVISDEDAIAVVRAIYPPPASPADSSRQGR
jgi:DNA-binding NtrC family response regulator